MAGVNDLASEWGKRAHEGWHSWRRGGPPQEEGRGDAYDVCASEIERVSFEAWHPVSDPPTEEDTLGVVPLVIVSGGDGADCWDYMSVQNIARTDENWARGLYWARISDVVLMPPEDQ